jgi:hypothetical protein
MRITAQQALERIQGSGTMRRAKGKPLTLSMTIHGRLYAFSGGGRTIIAPDDDRLPAILAECDTIPVHSKKSPELAWWLNEYALEMASLKEDTGVRKVNAIHLVSTEQVIIEPLLGSIKWGQRAPYWNNLKYPLNGKTYYCYVGCLATAISQVLYYWYKRGVKRGCPPTKAYTTATNKYAVAALTSVAMFDWESMTDAPPTTTKGKKAVALLCQYVSAALEMDYTPYKSAAKMAKAAPVLKDYFAMGDAKRLEARYMTAAKFKAEIIAELQKGHPVVMCGQSDESGCHAFICDGYRSTDDLFHFNWGYNGSGDGWFALTALTPDGKDFTSKKNAIVGLTPHLLGDVNGDGRINMSDVTQVINAKNKGEYNRQMDINSDGKVDMEDAQAITDTILGKS